MDYAAALDRVVRMTRMASAGNVVGVRAVVEDIEKGLPGYWQTTVGRLYMRLATIGAINNHKLGTVRYLCGERGVPALGDGKGDELGAFPPPPSSACLVSLPQACHVPPLL